MKILVFADFHGNISAIEKAVEISRVETPDKTVVCGDMFGWSSPSQTASALEKLYGVHYFVRGNNDYSTALQLLDSEEYAVMYHYGRTLFFTHGDRYNAHRIPPLLKEGDALVYGHTHVGGLYTSNGLYLLNVGSLGRPRDGEPSYLTLDDNGATLKRPDGTTLNQIMWR